MSAIENANILVLLTGALTALFTGIVTFLATRWQYINTQKQLKIEQDRVGIDTNRSSIDAASVIVNAAQTTTTMSLELGNRILAQSEECKNELTRVQEKVRELNSLISDLTREKSEQANLQSQIDNICMLIEEYMENSTEPATKDRLRRLLNYIKKIKPGIIFEEPKA